MTVDAVIFDWGGTLTRWHDIDFEAEAQALAVAAVAKDPTIGPPEPAEVPRRLLAAAGVVWGRSRDEQRSATVADVFDEAGLDHDPALLEAYWEFWEPHTLTDPAVGPTWERLRATGLRIGVLSNTLWPREVHRRYFERDGVLHLIDGDVYSSEIAVTKPSPQAFVAAVEAVGLDDPTRCVYVGDRLFDDVWGAQQAGLRAVHVPHSRIPVEQVGHSEGVPDAVVHDLAELPDIVERWR